MVVPVFVRWMNLGVVIYDLVGEREGGVSTYVTGVSAGVQSNECVLSESVSFALFISYLNHHVVGFDDFEVADPIQVG